MLLCCFWNTCLLAVCQTFLMAVIVNLNCFFLLVSHLISLSIWQRTEPTVSTRLKIQFWLHSCIINFFVAEKNACMVHLPLLVYVRLIALFPFNFALLHMKSCPQECPASLICWELQGSPHSRWNTLMKWLVWCKVRFRVSAKLP